MLDSLPDSLDETYERTLCDIDSHSIDDARRILLLLCFAAKPLTLSQLIDGIAVDTEGHTGLNKKRRLQGFDDIHEICPGFVEISPDPKNSADVGPIVRIAHFSIREYLESGRIQHQRATIFSLDSVTAHAEIAHICLVYLLEDGLASSRWEDAIKCSLIEKFPLTRYAVWFWEDHYKCTVGPVPNLDQLIIQLFQSLRSFTTWATLYDWEDKEWGTIILQIYHASLSGFSLILPLFIGGEQAGTMNTSTLSIVQNPMILQYMNEVGESWGNALQAASSRGHDQVVQMLLDRGANVKAPGGVYGNTLQAASMIGHKKSCKCSSTEEPTSRVRKVELQSN